MGFVGFGAVLGYNSHCLCNVRAGTRCWNTTLTQFLESKDLERNAADPCVFVRMEGDNPIIVAVYVDDLIILAKALEIMNTVKQALAERFKMKDLGEIHYCLGITIVHDKERNSICMHHKQYVNSIVEKFGLASAKTVATPADGNVQLRKDDGVSKDVDATLYQSMVGSLLYAAIAQQGSVHTLSSL